MPTTYQASTRVNLLRVENETFHGNFYRVDNLMRMGVPLEKLNQYLEARFPRNSKTLA